MAQKIIQTLIVIVACLTVTDVNTAICKTWCRDSNYDTGAYRNGKCFCANTVDFDVVQEKKIFLQPKKIPLTIETPSEYWPHP